MQTLLGIDPSPSSRRAWIEISSTTKILQSRLTSPSSRRAWIEIRAFTFLRSVSITSPSSRRAWIEIIMYPATEPLKQRRPPRGGRGLKYSLFEIFVFIGGRPPRGGRGLKSRPDMGAGNGKQSPSSRRAWIEIRIFACPHSSVLSRPPRGGRGLKSPAASPRHPAGCRPPRGGRGLKLRVCGTVRTRKGRPPRGGRGLKFALRLGMHQLKMSPSSRRAWIEISLSGLAQQSGGGRSPRGGRGLKSRPDFGFFNSFESLSSRRAWIEIGHVIGGTAK